MKCFTCSSLVPVTLVLEKVLGVSAVVAFLDENAARASLVPVCLRDMVLSFCDKEGKRRDEMR